MSKHVDLDPSRARGSELEQKERDREVDRTNEGLSRGLVVNEGFSQSARANEAAQNHANDATSQATERSSVTLTATIDELIQSREQHDQNEEPTDVPQTLEEHNDPGEELHIQRVRESVLEAKRHMQEEERRRIEREIGNEDHLVPPKTDAIRTMTDIKREQYEQRE